MERVHLDILSPFNRRYSGSVYILVMVDQFTKWVELTALPAQTAELTARAFLNHFIVTFGCYLEVHSDQGRNFESNFFQAFCKLLEITKTWTTGKGNIGQTQLRQKRNYDLRILEMTYSPGDIVYLRDSSTVIGISTKLRPPSTGPFLIIVLVFLFINSWVGREHL